MKRIVLNDKNKNYSVDYTNIRDYFQIFNSIKLVLHDAISLQLVSQRWKKKSIVSCERHITRCNLELQLVMVSKNVRIIAKSSGIMMQSGNNGDYEYVNISSFAALGIKLWLEEECDLNRNIPLYSFKFIQSKVYVVK